MGIYDKSGKLKLVYYAPVIRLPSGKTVTPQLDWDVYASSISVSLPELSFPLIIAFGLGVKFPDTKGGFHLSFPSFKFGAKGEIESSDSESDDENTGKSGGFGFGIRAPKFGAKGEIDNSGSDSDDEKKKFGGFGLGIKAPKIGFGHSGKGDIDFSQPETPVRGPGLGKPKVTGFFFFLHFCGTNPLFSLLFLLLL